MEKTAYEYKIFRQDAILSPEQFYPEKFSQGVVYIETESLQRRPHLVGMTTRPAIFAGTLGTVAVQAFADIGECPASVSAFHLQKSLFNPLPLRADKFLCPVYRDAFFSRNDFRSHQVGISVLAQKISGIEIERRASPTVPVVGALLA